MSDVKRPVPLPVHENYDGLVQRYETLAEIYMDHMEAENKRLVDALDDLMCAIKDDGRDSVRYTSEYDDALALLDDIAGIIDAELNDSTKEDSVAG